MKRMKVFTPYTIVHEDRSFLFNQLSKWIMFQNSRGLGLYYWYVPMMETKRECNINHLIPTLIWSMIWHKIIRHIGFIHIT